MGLLARVLARDTAAPIGGGSSPLRRADGVGGHWHNPMSGLGTPLDRGAYTTVAASDPLTRYEIDTLLRRNAMARRIVSREPHDCTRAGYKLVKTDDDELAARVQKFADGAPSRRFGSRASLKFLLAIRKARTWAKTYGGAAIVPDLDDGLPFHQPIDLTRIRKIRKLLVLDRYEIQPDRWCYDPSSRHYGEPETYRVTRHRTGRTFVVHADRVIRFDGIELPERVAHTYESDGWGGSELELVWEELRDYGTTNHLSAEALGMMSQGVLKSPGIAKAAEADGINAIADRIEAFRIAMGLFGEFAIDSDEDYQILGRPLSGVGEVGATSKSALVAASGIVQTILLGETPGGINAGEQAAEILAWYDHCQTLQPEHYQPALEELLVLLMASHEGPTGGRILDFEVEWNALWQESRAESAQRWLTNAQRRQIDIASGVISADEARQDEDLAEIYELDPTMPAPAPPDAGGEYAMGDELGPIEGEEPAGPMPPAETVIPPGAQLVSLRTASEATGFSANTIRGMVRRGEIKRWKAGGSVRVNLPDVMRAISMS